MAAHDLDAKRGVTLDAVMGLDSRDNVMHPFHHGPKAEHGARGFQSIKGRVAHLLSDLRAFDQCLAGYAAEIKAIAAHLVRFDQSDLGFYGGRDIGADEARGPSADDHEIAIEL